MWNYIAFLTTTTLLLSATCCCAAAHNAHTTFKYCLPVGVPAYTSSSPNYQNAVTNNFVNDGASPSFVIAARFEYDVRKAMECATRANLPVCARSGGHSYIGASLCSGVLIDLAAFRSVRLSGGTRATIGPAATLGDIQWRLWQQRRRWIATGVCPSVGAAGYILGGGHGPYEGLLGLACDSLMAVRMVDRHGVAKTVSRKRDPNLFWAMCGAGGGQFGIVTSFSMRTVASAPFDNAVVFRFRWPQEIAGEVLAKWTEWNQAGGRVWWRMEVPMGDHMGLFGYGACYKVKSLEQCERLLHSAAFFHVAGRETLVWHRMQRAVDVAAFFGPGGRHGSQLAADAQVSLTGWLYGSKGKGNDRTHHSAFLKWPVGNPTGPSVHFWQRYVEMCANPGGGSIPWIVCQLHIFNGAINKKRNNAFPYRNADLLSSYMVGGGSRTDGDVAYWRIRRHLSSYTVGGYVNYAERHLQKSEYPKYYWGKSLPRLKKLKRQYDPHGIFSNEQAIPSV